MKHFIFELYGIDLIVCIAGRHVSINYGDWTYYHDFDSASEAQIFYQNAISTVNKLI